VILFQLFPSLIVWLGWSFYVLILDEAFWVFWRHDVCFLFLFFPLYKLFQVHFHAMIHHLGVHSAITFILQIISKSTSMIHHLAFIAATACVSIIHHLAFIVCHCLCIDQLIQIFIKFISRFHSSCLPCLFVGFLSFQVYEPSAVPINLTFNAVPTSLSTSLQFQSHHVSFANISSSCLRLASSTPCVFHCLNCPALCSCPCLLPPPTLPRPLVHFHEPKKVSPTQDWDQKFSTLGFRGSITSSVLLLIHSSPSTCLRSSSWLP